MNRVHTVRGIIQNPQGLLLVQRPSIASLANCWEFPGGTTDFKKDSSAISAVQREVKEETGLLIKSFQFTGFLPIVGSKGDILDVNFFTHLCDNQIGKLVRCELETQAIGFFHLNELGNLRLTHVTKIGLILARKLLN